MFLALVGVRAFTGRLAGAPSAPAVQPQFAKSRQIGVPFGVLGRRALTYTSDAPLSRLVVLGFSAGFRIIDRGGDHISAADPFAEVDHAATVGAEREVRIAGQNNLAAGGTSERSGLFLRHGGSQARSQAPRIEHFGPRPIAQVYNTIGRGSAQTNSGNAAASCYPETCPQDNPHTPRPRLGSVRSNPLLDGLPSQWGLDGCLLR